MILQTIWEGLGLGALLALVCAVGIHKGAVGMVHLYSPAVQQRCVKLGLTTHEKIKRNSLLFKAVCVPGYARNLGVSELMPLFCELDEVMITLQHGVLHRKQTLANGGEYCDYFITGNKERP